MVGQCRSYDAVDQRRDDDAEARQVASGDNLEVCSVWMPAVIDLNAHYGSGFGKMADPPATVIQVRLVPRFERVHGRGRA
jgi:hypothetical protein